MFRCRRFLALLVAIPLTLHVAGCRKNEKETPSEKEQAAKRVEARTRNACEKIVQDFLRAMVQKDYAKAVEFIDVDEMIQAAEGSPDSRSPSGPLDVQQMKQMLISMLEKTGQQEGMLSYEVIGSDVSDDRASVDIEIYRDGKLVDSRPYALIRRSGNWKLRGSAVRASLPPVRTWP